MKPPFQRIGIVGVGLIGGSFGMAVKRAWPSVNIRGIGRDEERLRLACRMGAVDDCTLDLENGLRDRDLVLLATPVRHIIESVARMGGLVSEGTLITDAGSTKRRICEAAREALPESVQFIGGHPMAGREVAGVENSYADLFIGAPYVLCSIEGRPCSSLPHLDRLIRSLGAIPVTMAAEIHDRNMARISHLPQLVSTALAGAVAGSDLSIAGGGLKDMLRLAASPYSVWSDILHTNADNIDEALAEFAARIEVVRGELKSGDLEAAFSAAAAICSLLKKW